MNNKKKVMLGAAFVVAIMALAGVGYATVSTYKAQSNNTDNTAESTYIVMTQSKYNDAFNGSVYYSTTTAADASVAYEQLDAGANGTLLGTDVITVTPTNAKDDTYKITMQLTEGTAATGTYKIEVIGAGAGAVITKTAAELATAFEITSAITITTEAQDTTVNVYYLYSGSGTPASTPLNDVTFQFVATATVA